MKKFITNQLQPNIKTSSLHGYPFSPFSGHALKCQRLLPASTTPLHLRYYASKSKRQKAALKDAQDARAAANAALIAAVRDATPAEKLLRSLRRQSLPKELSRIAEYIQCSATALSQLSSIPAAENIALHRQIDAILAHVGSLRDLRELYLEEQLAVESDEETQREGDGRMVGEVTLYMGRSLLRSIEVWQEALQQSRLMNKSTKSPAVALISNSDVRNKFIELVDYIAYGSAEKIEQGWTAFLSSLGEAGVKTRRLSQMVERVNAAAQQVTDKKSIVLRDWAEELLEPKPLTWWALRKAWLRLREMKLLTFMREYHDEDFEGWSAFQKRTGDMRIAAWELVLMKRNFDKDVEKEKERPRGLPYAPVQAEDTFLLQPDSVRQARRAFMVLRYNRRRGHEEKKVLRSIKSGTHLVELAKLATEPWKHVLESEKNDSGTGSLHVALDKANSGEERRTGRK